MDIDHLPRIVFFGTPQIAVWVLDELERVGIVPNLIVTNPDKPQGRKLVLTPPPVKIWGDARGIQIVQPESLKETNIVDALSSEKESLFVVVAYGKIIPQHILDIPEHGVLNVHPSLLPKLRGASPIRSAILQNSNSTGVTIMKMDAELDHGPVVAQEELILSEWPPHGLAFDELMAKTGGKLLARVIPEWMQGKISPVPQKHEEATFCTKITKEMGEINLNDDPYQNLLKIRAFEGWPGTYFFTEKNGARVRVKIIDAELNDDGSLNITRIIPEGKKEMAYEDYLRN